MPGITGAADFHLYGADHWAALILTALAVVAACVWARRTPDPGARRRAARGLAVLLALSEVTQTVLRIEDGTWTAASSLPLELCDVALVVCVVALWTFRVGAAELAYFWGLAGTAAAILTPDLDDGFPHHEYLTFFAHHGGVVVAAVFLTAGVGITPRQGAWLRVTGWTLAYAGVAGAINLAFGTNYFYLREKPSGGGLLDLFGPWPYYIFGGALLCVVLFFLLDLPWRRARSDSGSGSE